MFSIIIKEFEFLAIIGVLEFEKELPQKVIVNCEIEYNYEDSYLDYAEVSDIIKKLIVEKKFEVIEDALLFVSDYLKNCFPHIQKIELEILKPSILGSRIVGAKLVKNY